MLLIKTKLWEQASCPPQHSRVKHRIFWIGHNLLRRNGFNQRTMGFVEWEELPVTMFCPRPPMQKKKKKQMTTPLKVLTLRVWFVMFASSWTLWGWEINAVPPTRWLLRFPEALYSMAVTCSPEGINLSPYSEANLPTERNRPEFCLVFFFFKIY